MPHSTTPETHRARIRHRCEWCWQYIEPGEQYIRWRYFSDGDAESVKMHPECRNDLDAEIEAQGGGYYEWTPGEFERPIKTQEPT